MKKVLWAIVVGILGITAVIVPSMKTHAYSLNCGSKANPAKYYPADPTKCLAASYANGSCAGAEAGSNCYLYDTQGSWQDCEYGTWDYTLWRFKLGGSKCTCQTENGNQPAGKPDDRFKYTEAATTTSKSVDGATGSCE